MQKILHIDDDEANRYAVKRILEKSGFDVSEAESGFEGLLKLREEKFDIIILDIKLPDIDGYEVCRRIKADSETRSIPVLQTSASFVSSEHKVEGLESGADGYLAQPIEAAVLVATVRSLLRIRQAEHSALQAQRARDQLLAIVSHDLRNPLSSIMMMSTLLQKQIMGKKLTDEEILQKIVKIQSSGIRMNRLIQDLLDVSSMDEGKFSVTKNPFSMNELIREVVTSFEENSAEANIEIKMNLPDQSIQVEGDKDRLFQVFSNLISNSLKFTKPQGKVLISLTETENFAMIVVADSGKGISKSYLEEIFNRYWQSPDQDIGKMGFGLGLSIVKGIVEAHGGSVRAESQEGVGTSIFFRIPKK